MQSDFIKKCIATVFICLLLVEIVPCGIFHAAADEPDTGYSSKTLETVNTFDYYTHSISTLSEEALTSEEIADIMKGYGTYIGNPGMPDELYREAMEQKWTDCTDRTHKFQPVSFDLNKVYTYNSLVTKMYKLSRIEGVSLFNIGKSTNGCSLYALEVDIPSDEEKDTIILTGTIHARETAGCTYIIKELIDLLQSKSKEAKEVLSRTRFVTVPCVNPDGREGICFHTKDYTYKSGELWKATSSGTDLNRNFPGLSWGQIAKGNEKSDYINTSPNKLYYPGPYAGSAPETRAMMKFLYHYIVLEKASIYIDYHQQGRIMYVEKPWCPSTQRELCTEAAQAIKDVINQKQKKSSSTKYSICKEEDEYGLNGVGSTMTDYACAIANGSKFSRAYGFNVYCTKKAEYPLIMIPRIDKTKKKLLEAPNKNLTTFSFEIGWGTKYLGYSSNTRKLLANEYKNYCFDRVLYTLSDFAFEHRS